MTSVPTINLLISSEAKLLFETLSDLGKSGGNIVNAVNQIKEEERGGILLFSNQANPNFISLEHSFLESEQKVIIKFIDPRGEFESNYLATGSIYRGLMATAAAERRANNQNGSTKTEAQKSGENLPSPDYEKLARIVGTNSTKPLYFTYGIGNDQTTWSSVHRMIITNFTFDSNASREFTLVLQPLSLSLRKSSRLGLLGEPVDINSFGFNTSVEGQSENIKFEKVYGSGYKENKVYGPEETDYLTDYHALVVDALSDYLRKASQGSNVIVLLPDLNKLLSTLIKRTTAEEDDKDPRGNLRTVIDSVLNKLYLSLKNVPNINGLTNFTTVPTQYKSREEANLRIPGPPGIEEKVDNYFKDYNIRARMTSGNSDDGIPDVLETIKKLFSAINKFASTSYTIDPVYFVETEISLHELWGDEVNKEKWTFNGNKIFDSEKPTIVIGDKTFIHNLLAPRPDTKEVPLEFVHPQNALDIVNEEYKSKIKKNLKYKDINKSVFGDISDVPDIFQYKDDVLSTNGIDLIEKNKVPVFRHNTSNPNVLTIKNYTDQGYYFLATHSAYKKQVTRVATQLVNGKTNIRLRDFKITDQKQLEVAIKRTKYSNFGPTLTNQEVINDIYSRLDSSLKNQISEDGDEKEIVKYIKALLDSYSEDSSVEIKISQEVNADPAVLIEKMGTEMARKTSKISLTSLPLFSLSSKTLFQYSPVVLFSQDLPMQGQIYPRRTRVNNYLTGVYQIIGWKHSLDSMKAESMFVLAKINNRPSLDSEVGLENGDGEEYYKALDAEAAYNEIDTFLNAETELEYDPDYRRPDTLNPQPESEEQEQFGPAVKPLSAEQIRALLEPKAEEEITYTEAVDATFEEDGVPRTDDGTRLEDLPNPYEPFSEEWYEYKNSLNQKRGLKL